MEVNYSRDALKFLAKLEQKSIGRIREAINGLTKMQGYSDGRKRLRIGPWRIIYKHEPSGKVEIPLIIDIGNRGDIYK